jgi:penicillin-binding protein 2
MALRRLKKRIFSRSLQRGGEIDPDQIFLDSSNLPEFDVHQFEGRLERPIGTSTFAWLSVGCVVVALIFIGRLWNLQVMEGQAYEERSENNRLDHTTIFANRGVLYDRNKVPLAWNELNSDGDFAKRAYATSSGFAHLLGYIRYPAKDSSGFYYEREFKPQSGAELQFNDELSGENGLKITETNALGHVLSENTLEPPTDGQNVYLSIDAEVQRKLHEYLKATIVDRGFLAGSAVVMDIHNGEVLALTNYPEYDPKIMAEGVEKEKIQHFLTDSNNPFLDRVVAGQFIPGSIMKPYVALGALEQKSIDPSKQILADGQITIPNPYNPENPTIFKDWKVHGWVDIRRALAVSSNVYFFAVGGGYEGQKGIGIANIEKYTKSFGFGSLTGIDVLGEKAGNIPSPAWKAETFE